MKRKHSHFVSHSLSFFLIMTIHACTCKPCDDPNLVSVPVAGTGNLRHHWEIIQAVQHTGGFATSSIQIIPSGTTSVNSFAADTVTTSIILVVEDTLAGVKCIKLNGGFGLTCGNASGGAIAIDGVLENKTQCMDLSKCCLKTNSLRYDDIGRHMRCGPGQNFYNGGIGITGIIENCKGIMDTVIMTINFL